MKSFLKFTDPAVELNFINNYDRESSASLRLGFWLAVFFYAIFGILDYYLMPLSYKKIWVIRYVVVIPFAFVTYLLSYIKKFNRFMQGAWAAIAIVMGTGIVAMMAISDEMEPGFRLYYAGLLLVIIGICSLFRLRFYYALFSSLVIIACYEINAVFVQHMVTAGLLSLNLLIFINNNFFFISANIIALIASYYFEHYSRVDYLRREEIKERHEEINSYMENMKTELELARQVQSRLLPESYPYLPYIRISSLYKPMETLGGDFYDFICFEEKHLIGIFISDVSGHGLPAALITSMLKALNRTAGNIRFSTSGFLSYINTHLTGQISDNFLTAIYGIYNSETRIFKFSRAGHPFPILIRDNEITQVQAGGGGIGFDTFMQYEEVSLHLEKGDKVILYTDGLTEQSDDSLRLFEEIYFEKILPSLAMMSIEDIITISYRRLKDFNGSEKFDDDICILGFEIL